MLLSFRELNRMAFVKAFKKHDKATGLDMARHYMLKVGPGLHMLKSKRELFVRLRVCEA